MRSITLTLAFLAGCPASSDDTDGASDPCVTACSWPVGAALYVCDGGSDQGDGSAAAPFATVLRGVEASREAGAPSTVRIGAGRFDASLWLAGSLEDGASDDGLELRGCGVEQTTLVASDPEAHVLRASAVDDLTVADLTLEGGRRSLWLWQGTTAALDHVAVDGASRVGVVVAGPATRISASALDVRGPLTEAGAYGYGIAVQDGRLEMTGGSVQGATAVGILVSGVGDGSGGAVLTDVSVSGTASDAAGRLGRGVMAQERTVLDVSGGSYVDNADAGIFALRATWLGVDGATVTSTRAALTVAGEPTGDGIVATRGDSEFAVSQFSVSIQRATVTDSARSGVLLSGVTLTALSGNALTGNLEIDGAQVFTQLGVPPAAAATDPVVDLATSQVLGINDTELDLVPTDDAP